MSPAQLDAMVAAMIRLEFWRSRQFELQEQARLTRLLRNQAEREAVA